MSEDSVVNNEINCKDYIRWKKNVPFLYDMVMTNELTWPSLTVQWLPDITRIEEKDYSTQRVILGTQAEQEQNYLMIATVTVPNNYKTFEAKHYDAERDEFGGYGMVAGHVDVSIKINHDGIVNRARSLPQCPNVIATKTESGDVLLFDYTRHPSKPDPSGKCKPDLVLKGHTMEGFGLSWCTHEAGLLLSSSADGGIIMWDVNTPPENGADSQKVLNPTSTYRGHNGSVEDVCWLRFSTELFVSVGTDRQLLVWDRRQGGEPIVRVPGAHNDDCICVDASPFQEHVLCTGSEDGTVGLWDLRHMAGGIGYLRGHKGAVTQTQWSPHREAVLASCGGDQRVHLWDLRRRSAPAESPHSPELAFVHAGHCAKVLDLNWNPNMALMLASVSYDNVLQLWQPSPF